MSSKIALAEAIHKLHEAAAACRETPAVKMPIGDFAVLFDLAIILLNRQSEQPIAVQACRPEDRAMLATPAGQELLRAASKALAGLPAPAEQPKRRAIGTDDMPALQPCPHCDKPIEVGTDQIARKSALFAEQPKPEPMPTAYTHDRIAWELVATATGGAYYGNALRVAKDFPELDAADRAMLDKWATGRQEGTDHIRLQEVAMKVRASGRGQDCDVCEGSGGVKSFMNGRDHWHPCPRGCVASPAMPDAGTAD